MAKAISDIEKREHVIAILPKGPKSGVRANGAISAQSPARDSEDVDVLRQMREDILNCVLQPDGRLIFSDLRSRYNASVGTLREALSHMVAEGLVHTERGRGFRVAPVSLEDLRDLIEQRVYFETKTLEDSIRHSEGPGADAWEAEIITSEFLLSKLERPTQEHPVDAKETWAARHKRYHAALVANCRSPRSLSIRSDLFDQARRYQWMSIVRANLQRKNEHVELRDAVLDRNIPLSCKLVEEHIRGIENDVVT